MPTLGLETCRDRGNRYGLSRMHCTGAAVFHMMKQIGDCSLHPTYLRLQVNERSVKRGVCFGGVTPQTPPSSTPPSSMLTPPSLHRSILTVGPSIFTPTLTRHPSSCHLYRRPRSCRPLPPAPQSSLQTSPSSLQTHSHPHLTPPIHCSLLSSLKTPQPSLPTPPASPPLHSVRCSHGCTSTSHSLFCSAHLHPSFSFSSLITRASLILYACIPHSLSALIAALRASLILCSAHRCSSTLLVVLTACSPHSLLAAHRVRQA
jgi:hypothetical protein